MIQRDALGEYVRGSLWVLPTACAAVALALGAGLSRVDVGPDSPLAFQGTADDARTLLIGITSTMVTVIALLLGLAVVALQLASTQYSPRLLRNFLRDRPNQVVLGVFVGTFAYSTAGLFTVGVYEGQRDDQFPRFAVTVAIVLLFLSLALLVYFADHLAHSIQVDNVMRVVERGTLPAIEGLATGTVTAPPVPDAATPVPAWSSGYVQVVHMRQLLDLAVAHRVNVRLCPKVGQHVVAGGVLAWTWPTDPDAAASTLGARVLRGPVRIGYERTLEQDPGFGIRQLVDAACKALSPAVNDPYTAVQAVEHLSVLFAALAARSIGDDVATDPATGATVAVHYRSFGEHLSSSMGLIRRYGASEPTVVAALLGLLTVVLAATGAAPDRWTIIEAQAGLLVTDCEREIAQPADLAPVRVAAAALDEALTARRAGVSPRPTFA